MAEDDEDLEAYWADVRAPRKARLGYETIEAHRKGCQHPREKWYADPEYGTVFCGICHADVTKLMDQEV